MIGGGGEQKTLRLVAKYADATNVFGGPETIHHKYEVLRRHCEAIGRDPDEIERSTLQSVRIAVDGDDGESPQQVIDRFGELADAGCQHVIFGVHDVWDPRTIERLRPGRAPGGREALGLSPRRSRRTRPPTPRPVGPACPDAATAPLATAALPCSIASSSRARSGTAPSRVNVAREVSVQAASSASPSPSHWAASMPASASSQGSPRSR